MMLDDAWVEDEEVSQLDELVCHHDEEAELGAPELEVAEPTLELDAHDEFELAAELATELEDGDELDDGRMDDDSTLR